MHLYFKIPGKTTRSRLASSRRTLQETLRRVRVGPPQPAGSHSKTSRELTLIVATPWVRPATQHPLWTLFHRRKVARKLMPEARLCQVQILRSKIQISNSSKCRLCCSARTLLRSTRRQSSSRTTSQPKPRRRSAATSSPTPQTRTRASFASTTRTESRSFLTF